MNLHPRTGDCVLRHSCKTARPTPGAQMPRIHLEKVEGRGAMWNLRFVTCVAMIVRCHENGCVLCELLNANVAEATWDHCAPAVDYDVLRRDISSAFGDKVVEVRGLVAKLQKTQHAAEQALDT